MDKTSKARSNGSGKPGTRASAAAKAAAQAVTLDDFYAYMPAHSYIFAPTRELWPGGVASTPASRRSRSARTTTASRSRSSERLARPEPARRADDVGARASRCSSATGSSPTAAGSTGPASTVFNLYRPPLCQPGDPGKAQPWLDHVALRLSGRRRPHREMACASRPAAGREDQSRARARRRSGHRQGHDPGAGPLRRRRRGTWRGVAESSCSAASTAS